MMSFYSLWPGCTWWVQPQGGMSAQTWSAGVTSGWGRWGAVVFPRQCNLLNFLVVYEWQIFPLGVSVLRVWVCACVCRFKSHCHCFCMHLQWWQTWRTCQLCVRFFVISAVSPVVVCVTVSVLVLLFWIFMSFGSLATPRSLTVFLSCSFLLLSLPPIILSAVVWSHRGHSWRWDMARDWPVLQHRLNGAGQDQVVGRGIPAHHDHPGEIVRPLRPPHALGTCRQCHLTEALMWRSCATQKITAKNKALTGFCLAPAAPVIISEGAAVVSIPEIRLINSHFVSRLRSCTPSEALQDSWWSKTELCRFMLEIVLSEPR